MFLHLAHSAAAATLMIATTLGSSQKPSSRVNQNALLTKPSVMPESKVFRSRAGRLGKLTTSVNVTTASERLPYNPSLATRSSGAVHTTGSRQSRTKRTHPTAMTTAGRHPLTSRVAIHRQSAADVATMQTCSISFSGTCSIPAAAMNKG